MKDKYQRMMSIMRQILQKMRVPLFLHSKSKHTFSVHQLIILLVLRQYESKSYEGMIEWLSVSSEIVVMLQLKTIPHFTTLQKVASRLSDILLHVAIGRFAQIITTNKIFAGIDATGFEDRHRTPYYSYRCNLRHSYTKCSAGSDVKSQLICAVVIQHHPVSHDVKQFPELFQKMKIITPMKIMVLDKGYDSESIHQIIRDNKTKSIIPVRDMTALVSRTKGRYRKLMKRRLDET